MPAGKVNSGESDKNAIIREIKEETNYSASMNQLEFLGNHEFHFPELELTFPTFRIRLDEPLQVRHNPHEHQAYRWVTPVECYAMPNLTHGLHDLLERIGYVKKV